MRDLSKDEVVRLIKEDGELYISQENSIDILIKYMPNRSVDTGYLYTLTEDLEDDGYEVICFILDHIKRIRSCYKQTDLRIELGEVVNECKTFANLKDIVFLTNSHLNRDAASTVDKAATGSKADLTRLLGKANIGESMLMLDNLDCCFIINVEYDRQGNKYMIFKRIKMRYRATNRDYICQPFVANNEIKLLEDFGSPVPVFKDTLDEFSQLNVATTVSHIKTSGYCNIQSLDGDKNDDTSSIYGGLSDFNFASAYSIDTPAIDGIKEKSSIISYTDDELEEQAEVISELICPIIMK
jgi:hypothetical protein